jgi:hypothetical protein
MNEGLFDEKDDDKSFQAFLNSNIDFWLWTLTLTLLVGMLLLLLVWLV